MLSILRKERRIVDHFRQAGATSPSSAVSLEEMPARHGRGLRRLRDRAVIREAAPGHLYLDEEVWEAVGRMRRRTSIAVLALLVLLIVAVLAVGRLIAPS